MRSALSRKLAKLQKLGAGDPNFSVQVVFHSSPRTKWASLAPLYDAAVRADCRNILFAQSE